MDTTHSANKLAEYMTTKSTESSPPLQVLNKPFVEQTFGKRTFYPALTKSKSETSPTTSSSQLHTLPSQASSVSADGQGESPSVRTCIAAFENWSPRSQRRFGQSSSSKTKPSELRDSLVQKSNDSLADADQGVQCSSEQDRGSLSSLSRSNESLEERSSLIHSAENVNNGQRNTSGEQISAVQDEDNLLSYGEHFISGNRELQENSTSSERDEIILPPLPTAKPTSPTLESGYNSHNTPDNRSVVSELSLSSAGSGSLSVTSRNSSTVSKDSVEFPALPQSVTVVHVRQKSMEEIECEQQVAQLVRQLPESEKVRISEVILPPPEHKTATDYMSGLFDTYISDCHRPSSKAIHSNQSSVDVNNKKNESRLD